MSTAGTPTRTPSRDDSAASTSPATAEAPGTESGNAGIPAPKPKKQNAVWRSCDDATLVSVLKAERDLGHQADNGWKGVAWHAAAAALVGGPGGVKTWTSCRDHWRLVRIKANLVISPTNCNMSTACTGFQYCSLAQDDGIRPWVG